MGIEDLTQVQIVQGILGLIALSITITVGIIIVSKYFEYKRHELLTVGISYLFISSGWWGSQVNFVLFILFDSTVPTTMYLVLTVGLQPITHLFWIYSFGYLVYPKSRWKFVLIFSVISALYEFYFIFYMITDPAVIGTKGEELLTYNITPVFSLYSLFIAVVGLITVLIFSRELLKAEDQKTKWRGKFLLISMILILINTVYVVTYNILQPPPNIPRSIIFSLFIYGSVITAYFAWIMPEWLERWLIKEEK